MLDYLRRFHATFHDSEIILWARLQFVLLLVYQGLQAVDITAVISDHRLLQCYIFTNAVVTEMLRRNREDWKNQ